MAAPVSAQWRALCEVTEVLALSMDNAVDVPIVHSIGSPEGTLNATSTPPVTKVFSDTIALAAGVGALDLTSLTAPGGMTARDFTGLKVQVVGFICPTSNTGGITVDAKDAVTGYNLFGADNAATTEKNEILPGTVFLLKHTDKLQDVDATHKDITLAGTGTDTIQVLLVAG